jgi:hypothetical protein
MAVVEVNELWDGRGASGTFKRQRQYTRTFEVVTDDARDGPIVVSEASGLPKFGFPYITPNESDLGALVVSIDPQQDVETPHLWKVTVKYDSKLDFPEGQQPPGKDKKDPKNRSESPLDRPPKYQVGFVKTMRPWIVDGNGKAIVNSAGRPFDPPLEEDIAYLSLRVTVNKAAFWADQAAALIYSVNKKAWFGLPARMVKIDGIEADSQYENNVGFWQVIWTLLINREVWQAQGDAPYLGGQGWDRRVLDCGYEELADTPGGGPPAKFHKKITDKYGKDPTSAVPLLFGRKMLAGDEPRFITFTAGKQLDFAGQVP